MKISILKTMRSHPSFFPLSIISLTCLALVFIFSIPANTTTKKTSIIHQYMIPNYFNMQSQSNIPVYYIIPKIPDDPTSKVIVNFESNNTTDKFIIDFKNIDYSSCIENMPYSFLQDIPKRIINYTNDFNECMNNALKGKILSYTDIQKISHDPVVNEYKNSDKKLESFINQVKAKKVLSTYDAIKLYVLAYTVKSISEIKDL